MQFSTLSRVELTPAIKIALAQFRHRVFIDRLRWPLEESVIGFEIDQYDRDDTIYVIAFDDRNEICGCARLLPTTSPYLLEERFSELLGNTSAPHHSSVWELSRLAISQTQGMNTTWPIKHLLAAIVKYASQHGAQQLIGVTSLSIERLLQRVGITLHRLARPLQINGRQVIACRIYLDNQTHRVLEL